ncbi:MAG: recombination protein RecR [Candidatus Eisenbacteria bacterium]|uniref:Recombination protein RecR n=1 Tax=Eiseniibacteriota bacterium TaxID=2212470 RepID=A0A956SEP6_UNCEI|nr:recombination protein RecR [Candidatus Eisenbacteria bacterium]MCB9463085.1 recombination protein RecR [Candidatus Eisenbacteria bacterium]
MQYSSRYLEDLVERLALLPTIGKKTAQRLAFHLLKTDEQEALALALAIQRVRTEVGVCEVCGNIAETQPCYICGDARRDKSVLCVVEQPGDVVAVEKSGAFRGQYHVLRGALSPLDGVGPEDLRIAELSRRLDEGGIGEVIVATNPTAQGEATAHYLHELLSARELRITRIARGIPVGADLELSDQVTLARALEGRKEMD